MRFLLLAISVLVSGDRPQPIAVGAGTAVVALRANGVILAGVDSQENYIVYRDGASSASRRTVCKVAHPGPFFAVIAGVTHGADGFDAVAETSRAWRSGDTLDALATRLRAAIPARLIPLLESLRAADAAGFASRYVNQVATQILLTGSENGLPQVRILEFFVTGSDSVSIAVRARGCPEECAGRSGAWFLGIHDRIDEFLRANARAANRADEPTLDRLLALEYEARPDAVGGPLTIVRVTGNGAELVRAGACSGVLP